MKTFWWKIHLQRRSRTATTSKMEYFVIIVNGWEPLTIITKSSILDVAAALDPPLVVVFQLRWLQEFSLKNVQQKKFIIRWNRAIEIFILNLAQNYYRKELLSVKQYKNLPTLHKKWSFPLRICSVNMAKFTFFYGYGHVYWRNP